MSPASNYYELRFASCAPLALLDTVTMALAKPKIPSGLAQKVADVKPSMEVLRVKYKSQAGQVLAMCDSGVALLQQHGLMNLAVSKHVSRGGFHPRNRSLRGLTPSNVPKKLIGFKHSDFSLSLCYPTVVQRIPGDMGDDYEAANATLCNAETSKNMLAPITPGLLDCFTLTCNHTWQAVKLADHSKITTHGEFPGLAQACSVGIKVDEVHWVVEVEFPWMIDLMIEADNVVFQNASVDSSLDLLFKIQGLSSELVDSSGKADWGAILSRMKRTEFKRVNALPHYIDIVKGCCLLQTGKPNELLSNLDAFVKKQSHTEELPAASLAKLSQVWLGVNGCPHFVEGLFKACLKSPPRYIVNSQNVYLLQGDVLGFGKQQTLKFVQAGESNLATAHNIASQYAQHAEMNELFDVLLVRTAAHIVRRPIFGEHKSLNAVASIWYKDVEKFIGHKLQMTCPSEWHATVFAAPKLATKKLLGKQPQPNVSQPSTASLDPTVQHFKDKGVERGSLVAEKVSKLKFEVVAVTESTITLKSVTDGTPMEASTSGH